MADTLTGLSAEAIRTGLLRGLIGPGARYGAPDPDMDVRILEAIEEAEADLQLDLSTRFKVTVFKGWMGSGVEPGLAPGEESEPPYDWPGQIPGDNFPRIRTKIRPVISLETLTLTLPGGIQPRIEIPPAWIRMDHVQGELMVAPSIFNAPLNSAGMSGPLILGMAGGRIPKSVLLNYTAGIDATSIHWPKIKRLVELRATIRFLPDLSLLINPEILTSVSADGLSQSRTSGYVFKDLEERLQAEYDKRMDSLLSLWDGPGSMLVL